MKIQIQNIWNEALTERERGLRTADGPAQGAWLKREGGEHRGRKRHMLPAHRLKGNKQRDGVVNRRFTVSSLAE